MFDLAICINLFHISPWNCTLGVLKGCSKVLKLGGKLLTYGAYSKNGILTPQSNVNFDNRLKKENSEWGVRDMEVIFKEG